MTNVVQLPLTEREDSWKRRLALQIATQLPEKPADALDVLRLTETLVRDFMMPGGP